jgi:hypothetical protein
VVILMSVDQRLRNLRKSADELLGVPELPRPNLSSNRCPMGQRDKKFCNTCDFVIRDAQGYPTGCDPRIKKWWEKKQKGRHPTKQERARDEGVW